MRHSRRFTALRTRGRLFAVTGAALAVITVCGGVALATDVTLPFSGDGNTINGCYNASDGTLRLLTPKSPTCSKGSTPISWNQTGPAGTDGTDGAAGQPGAPGISGLQQVTGNTITLTGGTGSIGSQANCPAGTRVISGGYTANNTLLGGGAAYSVIESAPGKTNPKDGSDPVEYWEIQAANMSQGLPVDQIVATFQAVAICANVAS